MSHINYSFSNPILKDRIEILKDTDNILIFRTFLEPNGGQTGLHYHTKFSEKFRIAKGELSVFLGKEKKVFKANESLIIEQFTSHKFFNTSHEEVIFDVEIINPKKMKYALQIIYGIAKEGKINNLGLPRNVFHLAIGLDMMNAYSPDFPHIMQFIAIKTLSGFGKMVGIEKELLKRYCND
jgi:mannose-6-phosphate isomerase-like protein (cupin superfamily)